MKKSAAGILLGTGGLAVSLLLAFCNLYWIGFSAGRLSEWIILPVSLLLTAGAAFAGCLLQTRFCSKHRIDAPAFFFIAFVPSMVLSGLGLALAWNLPFLASIAASLLTLSWTITSVILAVFGAIFLGILTAGRKTQSQ